MYRPNAETIAFLTPGLVHQFGNVLLTVQGHALHLDTAAIVERARDAILGAAERGGATLRLLRHLLGDPSSGADDAGAALTQIVDLLRVPVRERGFTLDATSSGEGPFPVQLRDFAPLLVEGVRSVTSVIPDGARGRIDVRLDAAARDVVVRVTFVRAPDSLPFPLAADEAANAVSAAASRCGWSGACRAVADGVEVVVELSRAATEA